MAAEGYEQVIPVYETMPGWSDTTFGAKSVDALPQAARDYIRRLEEITGVPVRITSYNVCYTKLLRSCAPPRKTRWSPSTLA